MKASRRGFFGGAATAAVLPGIGFAAPVINQKRKDFVLLHGTWHGGWAWHSVATLLRAEGHRVITPTMTGCGERFHLIRPDTGLSTHIEDLVNAIEWEELEDVILVCHSFAGTTATGAADRLQDRVKHLVFYDALIPTADRPAAIMPDPETGEFSESWQERVKTFRDGYKMIFWDHYPVEMLVPKEDSENIALLKRRLTWHPARQWTEPLRLKNGGWEAFPRTCIEAAGQIHAPSSEAMIGPGRGPGWNFISLDIARNGFLTDPAMLAECLASIG
ncbi:alpha/beta fold hydrolase [Altererythrobacter sp. GH1-8]|uniref:alpha/beta fold hydrolase n=1 Tax=Altererythrobacter sp. GH1-8 TaxID=3349333 RepID=UPI00374CF250